MKEQPPQPEPQVAAREPAIGEPSPIAPEREPADHPSIWVGSWLDYNNGVLHGDWIPADRNEADVWADVHSMLARSPTAARTGEVAEDWGIFDFDNFGPLQIGEQETIAWVTKVARGIAEHGLAFAAWADVMEEPELLDGFSDAYLGHYDSLQAYAEQFVDEAGYDDLLDDALPDSIRSYMRFDTALLARDLQASGDVRIVAADDGVWIFQSR